MDTGFEMQRVGRIGLIFGSLCLATSTVTSAVWAQDNAADENPLVVQPQTPSQRIGAALLLLKLTRPDLAKEQIDLVLAEDLPAEELIKIRDAYGTGTFLRLARNRDLMPSGGKLLDSISKAAREAVSGDGYLDELLEGFNGNRDDSAAALREIKRLGPDGVIALVERAGNGVPSDLRLERVLSLLGQRAVGPLVDVVFESERDDERELAIRVLDRTATVDQIPALVAVAANKNEPLILREKAKHGLERLVATSYLFDGAQTLWRAAQAVLGGQAAITRDNDEDVLLYGVESDTVGLAETLTRLDVSESVARKRIALRYLDAAIAIDPDDKTALRMAYVIQLETSDDMAAEQELFRRGPAAADSVLDLALDLRIVRPAVAALKVIATGGRPDAFSDPSAAARALDAPSPTVQFAAAEAAVKVEPFRPFPNSSRVTEIFNTRLAGDSSPKVVVVDPNIERGGDIGGRLRQLGLTPILAESGREGFRQASSRSDIVLAVVHANATNWELTPTVDNFYADARTASIPVAVVASTQSRGALNWVRSTHPGLMYVPVQSDTDGFRRALKPALAQIEDVDAPNDPQTRKQAAAMLRTICERRLTDIFPITDLDPLLKATFDADAQIAIDSIAALGFLPSKDSQTSLAEMVLSESRPNVRLAASNSLVRSLAHVGSVLSASLRQELLRLDVSDEPDLARNVSAIAGLLK